MREKPSAGPRPDPSPRRRKRRHGPDRPQPQRTRHGGVARILVIEDEPEARHALTLVLEGDRHEVKAVSGGEEALLLIEAFAPDLVVMDWRMPGLAGSLLCRRIRERPDAPPVVVVSSADEAFESHADIAAALRKPVDVERLRSVIADELGEP